MPDSQGYVRSGGDIHTDGHTSAGEREDHMRGGGVRKWRGPEQKINRGKALESVLKFQFVDCKG